MRIVGSVFCFVFYTIEYKSIERIHVLAAYNGVSRYFPDHIVVFNYGLTFQNNTVQAGACINRQPDTVPW